MESTKILKEKAVKMFQYGLTKRKICFDLKISFKNFDKWTKKYLNNNEFMAVRSYFTGDSKDIVCTRYNIDLPKLNALIDKIYWESPENTIIENNIQSGLNPWLSNIIYKSL